MWFFICYLLTFEPARSIKIVPTHSFFLHFADLQITKGVKLDNPLK